MYDLLLPLGIKGLKGVLKRFLEKFVTELIFSIFPNLQVDKFAEYCIFSNKCHTSQFQSLISAGDSVTDVFSEFSQKIFTTAMLKSNRIFV